MYSTSELDELFQILNSIKGFKLDNHIGATQQYRKLIEPHRGSNGILLFFRKTRSLQSRSVVTLFHLFTIAIYGRNCFDMQH